MVGEITKIHQTKESRNRGTVYLRLTFNMFKNDGTTYWAKTDLVSSFRNYARWKALLQVGNVLGNLDMKDDNTVDADSFPRLVRTNQPKEKPAEQGKLFG